MRQPRYTDVWDWSNLVSAWKRARRGKRRRISVASFERDGAMRLWALQGELREGTYRPRGYRTFVIRDPKRRLISAAPFRDRIVHQALCAVIEPVFERRFVSTSFASRPGRGTHAAIERCQAYAQQYRYVLACDVEQYFASIDHGILLQMIRLALTDRGIRRLCEIILEGGALAGAKVDTGTYFPGDDRFALTRPRSLPIGNLTSQLWANVYLDSLDHFVRRTLRCRAYIRYVDDFLLFSDSKSQLRQWRHEVIERLARLRLRLHEQRCHTRPTRDGIPFLGFVVFPTHRRLKRRVGIAYRRRLACLVAMYRDGLLSRAELEASVQGWVAHLRHGRTRGLRRAVFDHCGLWRPRHERPT